MMGLGMLIALPAMILVTLGVLAVTALPVVWLVREFGRDDRPATGAGGRTRRCVPQLPQRRGGQMAELRLLWPEAHVSKA